ALPGTVAAGTVIIRRPGDCSLHLRNLATGKDTLQLAAPPQFASSSAIAAAVTPDGKRAAVMGQTGVAIFDLTTGKITATYAAPMPVWEMNFFADVRFLRVTLQDPKESLTLVYVDAETGRVVEAGKLPPTAPGAAGGAWPGSWADLLAGLQKLNLKDS